MGSLYPLCAPHRRPLLVILSSSQEDPGGTRDGRLDLCGDGGGAHHPLESRTFDQGDAGEFHGSAAMVRLHEYEDIHAAAGDGCHADLHQVGSMEEGYGGRMARTPIMPLGCPGYAPDGHG